MIADMKMDVFDLRQKRAQVPRLRDLDVFV